MQLPDSVADSALAALFTGAATARDVTWVSLPGGQTLCDTGETADQLFYLRTGRLGAIRREEGKKGSAVIGATSHHCLEFRDLEITFDNQARLKVAAQLRRVNPFMVFTTAPQDYMFDHEITSALVRDACFAASAPLYPAEGNPIDHVPYLYYADAIEGHNYLGQPSPVACIVDISSQIDQKSDALKAHDSQRSWLMRQHDMDNYIESMKTWSAKRGAEIGVEYAEAFHQHLGHPHPQDNKLAELLNAKTF